ncbi:MAG: hypothetical protein GWN84_23840, partial [Gammaproteobacteria bacterium]|nr:hypothetical protein [Gammaproteobacteria bacterium]NIR85614.1 hypothetical protein [Gammaproteobacteria bacterium]NIU05154.1 hypothetical protein [Gammaproteobacteria bacterium]NIX86427.1 hypothetical protein [Gammaproteobacteria bacterium]
ALRWEYLEIKPQAEALAAQMSQAYEKGEVMISKYPTATSCVHQLKMIRERYRRCQPRRGVSLEAISKTIAGLEKAVSSVEAYAENEG